MRGPAVQAIRTNRRDRLDRDRRRRLDHGGPVEQGPAQGQTDWLESYHTPLAVKSFASDQPSEAPGIARDRVRAWTRGRAHATPARDLPGHRRPSPRYLPAQNAPAGHGMSTAIPR